MYHNTTYQQLSVKLLRKTAFSYLNICLYSRLLGVSFKPIPTNKKGQVDLTKLDWPGAFISFNTTRYDSYKSSFFKSVQTQANELKMYDKYQIGWIVACCLFLGSPIFFTLLMKGQKSKDAANWEAEVNRLLAKEKERIRGREANVQGEIQRRTKVADQKVLEARADVERIKKENEALKAKVEFAPLKAKTSEVQKPGVLDKGIF